jgi:hypothetical protein
MVDIPKQEIEKWNREKHRLKVYGKKIKRKVSTRKYNVQAIILSKFKILYFYLRLHKL